MIIRIDFKDNDYQELVENYLKLFNLNILYDLSVQLDKKYQYHVSKHMRMHRKRVIGFLTQTLHIQ